MFFKLLSILLTATMLELPLHAGEPTLPDAPSATQAKLKADINKYASEQKKITLTLTDAGKVTGTVQQTGEESFLFADGKSGEAKQIDYNSVIEVKKVGMSTTAKVLLISLCAATGVAIGLTVSRGCSPGVLPCR